MKHKVFAFLILVPFALLLGSCAEQAPVDEAAIDVEPEPAKPQPGDMVLVPAGEFVMGSDEKPMAGQAAVSAPEHKVDLPAFYIDAYEVTYGQWMRFTTESEYTPEGNWRQYYTIGQELLPVTNVTWEDAQAYCEWVGKRLPTEAEWEKAARGAEGLPYPWGDKYDPTKANCNELGYRKTIEVGEIETDKSPYGAYDMMGNAQEWTSDMLKPYPGSPARGDDSFRRGFVAVRGGSYAYKCSSMTLATRPAYLPKSQYGTGVRCAKDAEEEAPAEGEAPAGQSTP